MFRRPISFRAPEPLPPDQAASLADLKWFEVFKDPELQKLVRAGLAQNYDLRDAVARVEQARANLGITRSNQIPQLGAGGDVDFTRLSRDGSFPLPATLRAEPESQLGRSVACRCCPSSSTCGAACAAPRKRRAPIFFRAEENRKAVVTTLVSDVATAYFNLRELDYELDISTRTLATRQESLRIDAAARRPAESPRDSDLRQSEQLVETAAETIPSLQQQIEQTENQISLLLGQNPGPVARGKSLTEQEFPPEVPSGIPSALLERRPDIRAAEQNLIAANAQIGVAKAAYFPQISLTAALGGQSTQLSSLFAGPKAIYSFVPQVSQPIFTAGKLKSGVKLAEAERDERAGAI